MGAIRGVLLVFCCVVMFLALLVGNFLWTVSSSLQYDNVKPQFVSFVSNIVGEQMNIEDELGNLYPAIELYCQSASTYVFDYGGSSVEIPCSVLQSGMDSVIAYGVGAFFDKYYFMEYNCDFWNCFGDGDAPLFLISQKAQNYWAGKFYWIMLLSLALTILIFLLAEKKSNSFILIGSLTIVSSLLLLKIENLATTLTGGMGNLGDYASQVVSIFFTQSGIIFARVILIGVAILAIGIVMKIFHLGMAISNFFGKFRKNSKKSKPEKEDTVREKPSKNNVKKKK